MISYVSPFIKEIFSWLDKNYHSDKNITVKCIDDKNVIKIATDFVTSCKYYSHYIIYENETNCIYISDINWLYHNLNAPRNYINIILAYNIVTAYFTAIGILKSRDLDNAVMIQDAINKLFQDGVIDYIPPSMREQYYISHPL